MIFVLSCRSAGQTMTGRQGRTGQKRLSCAQLSFVIEIIIQDFSAFFKFIVLIVLGEFSYHTSTCTNLCQESLGTKYLLILSHLKTTD
jgi:hypothetical protein